MDMSTEGIETGKRAPRGRREKGTNQEAVIQLAPIKERVEELVSLYNAAQSAGDEFAEAIKKAAEDSGLLAAVVRKFVVARAGEKYSEAKTSCEQLSLLFDEVGLVR